MAALRVPQKLTSEHADSLLGDLAQSTDVPHVPGKISATDPLALRSTRGFMLRFDSDPWRSGRRCTPVGNVVERCHQHALKKPQSEGPLSNRGEII